MGIGLMTEGFLSACYHVCPNKINFQFDTSFMYIIAVLCMLRIYQFRHPDVNASSHGTFVFLSCVILFGVIGVLIGSTPFSIIFSVIHLVSCFFFSIQIYYMNGWKENLSMFVCNLKLCSQSPLQALRPQRVSRMVLLVLGNAVNWGLALRGSLTAQQDNFPSHLLDIFMINLLLYLGFYIVMKLINKEGILPSSVIYGILTVVSCGFAMHYFLDVRTNWKLTPAQSKDYNQTCDLMSFYDTHDIWHFLSAAGMFFSFMLILTLDDNLKSTPRSKIIVF